MAELTLVIRGGSVVTPEGTRRLDVAIEGDTVVALEPTVDAPGGALVLDFLANPVPETLMPLRRQATAPMKYSVAGDYEPCGFNPDWYQKWYKSGNHARLEGIENDRRSDGRHRAARARGKAPRGRATPGRALSASRTRSWDG